MLQSWTTFGQFCVNLENAHTRNAWKSDVCHENCTVVLQRLTLDQECCTTYILPRSYTMIMYIFTYQGLIQFVITLLIKVMFTYTRSKMSIMQYWKGVIQISRPLKILHLFCITFKDNTLCSIMLTQITLLYK